MSPWELILVTITAVIVFSIMALIVAATYVEIRKMLRKGDL